LPLNLNLHLCPDTHQRITLGPESGRGAGLSAGGKLRITLFFISEDFKTAGVWTLSLYSRFYSAVEKRKIGKRESFGSWHLENAAMWDSVGRSDLWLGTPGIVRGLSHNKESVKRIIHAGFIAGIRDLCICIRDGGKRTR